MAADVPADGRYSPFQRVYRLAYLARSLHTTTYRVRRGPNEFEELPVYAVSHPREFRRAFVKAMLPEPFQVTHNSHSIALVFCGRTIGRITPRGRKLVWNGGDLSPISLDPSNVDKLAARAFLHVEERIEDYYRELVRPCGSDRVFVADPVAGGYCYGRRRRLRAYAIYAIKTFCAELDPVALKTLRRGMLTKSPVFKDVMAAVSCPTRGTRWRQALDAYPAPIRWVFAFDAIVDPRAARYPSASEYIGVSIDRGWPLASALAGVLGISATELRRLHRVMPQRIGRLPHPDAAAFIAALPPHLRPVRREDWRAAFELYSLAEKTLNHYGSRFETTPADLRERAKSLTVGMKVPLGREPRIALCNGLNDVVTSLRHLRCDFATAGLERLPLGRVAELVQDWHRVEREASLRAAQDPGDLVECAWPPMLPPGTTVPLGDYVGVELMRPSELAEEGRVLAHCVGGYYPTCFAGRSRIFSLRDAEGKPHSTIQIQQVRGRLKIVQHHSYGNGPASGGLQPAGERLVRHLQKFGTLDWPALPTPPSTEMFMRRRVNDALRAFFRARLPGVQMPDQAQFEARVLEDAPDDEDDEYED